ncbi:MAG: LamG domain-containing protein, partial [Candidatus Shapirobacteria bacterium]|nr:LamG domain-containing protein [Candidatus Shapirobacteria bacterium]
TPYINLTDTFTVSLWIKGNNFNPTTDDGILSECESSTTGKCMHLVIRAGKPYLGFYGNDLPSNTTLETNKWYHLTYLYDGTKQKIYINGNLDASRNATPFNGQSGIIYVGKSYNSSSYVFDGNFDEFKIYPYARTADQIKQDYNSRGSMSGSSVNLGVQSNTSPNLKSSLIAHYKFDEGSGTTTNDSSENKNNLTFGVGNSSPVWSTNSKTNKALSFNGLTTYIENNSNNDVFNLVNNLTVSAWVNPSSFSGSSKYIFGHYYQYGIYLTSSGTYEAILRGNDGTYYYPTSSKTLNLNEWQYLTLSFNEGEASLFINGKFINSSTIPTTTLYNISTDLITIGSYFNGSRSNNFNGLIDEVKIYNRALTPEEIKQDYNAGSAIQFGSTSQSIGGTTTSLEYCIPGDTSFCAPPVAEWNFEENTGTTAKDTSGNNNNGTFGTGNSSPTWDLGVNNKGAGLKFDGTNDYINSGNNANLNITGPITLETWVKPTVGSGQQGLIGTYTHNGAYSLYLRHTPGSDISFWINPDGNARYIMTGNVNYGYWNHIATTWDGNNIAVYLNGNLISLNSGSTQAATRNFQGVYLGYVTSISSPNFLNGILDQTRIYNYARTPAQIAYDYNRGAPVGWWKLDECQGSTAFDSSGFGNTGVISIGQSGTQTTLGTCQTGTSAAWTNGASGKINSSLKLDGQDDYITSPITVNGSNATIAFWVKNPTSGIGPYLLRSNAGVRTYITISGNTIGFMKGSPTAVGITGKTINPSEWNHVVLKWWTDNNGISYGQSYINGQALGTGSSFTDTTNGSYITLGGYTTTGTQNASGQFDDVRVYNYTLTSEQIKQVYNGGSVNFK